MNFNNYIFNNKKFALFLIILIFGFLCIGSCFAVNVDDSKNDLNIGSNVNLKSDSSNLNNNLVSDEVNSKPIDFENSKVQNLPNSNVISNSDLIKNPIKSSSKKPLIKPPTLRINNVSIVCNESALRYALMKKSPEIRFANNITLTKYIKVSNKVKIDGDGYTLRNLKNQNGFFHYWGAIQLSAKGSTISNCIFEKTKGRLGGCY